MKLSYNPDILAIQKQVFALDMKIVNKDNYYYESKHNIVR